MILNSKVIKGAALLAFAAIFSAPSFAQSSADTLKKYSIGYNIKYLEKQELKIEENKNLISEFIPNELNKNNNINDNEKQNEIFENINNLEKIMGKIINGENVIENELINIKSLLQKDENMIYLEKIFEEINNNMNHGNYILNDNTYDYFLNMFNFILENFPENDKILRNIISLS